MSVRVRGMKTVKTLAVIRGSGTHSNERHVHQFQLGSMEIEAARLNRERHSAIGRIAAIDARLTEIDQLSASHEKALGLVRAHPAARTQGPPNHTGEAVAARRVLRY